MARELRRPRPKPVTSTWDLLTPSGKAAGALEDRELFLPTRPQGNVPALPDDPTELHDSALMSLFSSLTEWVGYMGTQLAAAEVDERSSSDALEQHKALSAVRNASEKTVTAAKARAYEDPAFVEAQEAYRERHAYRKLLEGLYKATEAKSTLLSRELTRRVGREPREGRAGRWTA